MPKAPKAPAGKLMLRLTGSVLALAGLIAALTAVARNSYDFLDAYWKLKQLAGLGEPNVGEFLLAGHILYLTLDGPYCYPEDGPALVNIGTLVCGRTYEVSYRRADNGWIVTGDHREDTDEARRKERESSYEPQVERQTHVFSNADPKRREISIWGAPATFDESGAVFLRGSRIGRLNLPKP